MSAGLAGQGGGLPQLMQRLQAQQLLFAPLPSRLDLLGLPPSPVAGAVHPVRVWRNHAIETVLRLAQPYLDQGGLALDATLSAYDDSLGFAELDDSQPAAELLWLDGQRSAGTDWLAARVRVLRQRSRAPILVVSWWPEGELAALQAAVADLPDVQCADLGVLCGAAGQPLLDARMAKVSGTPLSATALVLAARELACHWLAALLLPPVKAVAVDLDHTLYAGVLGEDGPAGVQLTPGHAALQQQLRGLRERGVFLALVSRNEAVDVQALFEQRSDFALRWRDFSVTEVSWGDKAQALARVAARLNIDVSALAFVDDNPGELAQVGQQLPTLRSVFAHADAHRTARALAHLPGLWRWRVTAEDGKRVADLQANACRSELAAADPEAYFKSLGVRLQFAVNAAEHRARMAEMSGKTNQFNLALARLSESDYAARLVDPDCAVVTVALADRFADSGLIALLAARRVADEWQVEELLISCRALGRRLEDSIVIGALQCLPWQGMGGVRFHVTEGPRNQPARQWLGNDATRTAQHIHSFQPPEGVQIERAPS